MLRTKIQTCQKKSQRFDYFDQCLEQELDWIHQLSGIAILKPKKSPSRSPKYDSLVKGTQLADVTKLGKTKQGVFYLGGIAIDGQQLFVSRAGQKGEIRARFAAGAVALLTDSLRPVLSREAIAQRTHDFNQQRDQEALAILSGKKPRGW